MTAARSIRRLLLALVLALATLVLAVSIGSETIGWADVLRALTSPEPSVYSDIVLKLRLPRALAAFAAGALLALAGALMQILVRNPLADPYVLGLAGGAGTGALGALLLGLDSLLVLGAAWAGALLSVALVLWFGRREFFLRAGAEVDQPLRLLLTGVALATGWGALITLLLALAPEASLRGMLFWLMGDLDGAETFGPALAGLALVLVIAWSFGRELNVLLRGAVWARTLGISVERVRLWAMLLASAATALAVTTVGTIGFVGLIVPNAVRLLLGNDQRLALPACALGGGALLTLADTLARTLAAPIQLPVGAVIAMAGVPAFIWLVLQGGRRS